MLLARPLTLCLVNKAFLLTGCFLMPLSSLALTWALSTISGYGLYGTYLTLQFLRRGGGQMIVAHEPGPIALPTLMQMRLAPTLDLARKLAAVMAGNASEMLAFKHPVLYAVGNDCAGFAGQDRVRGTLNVGCAAVEHPRFGPAAVEYARNYDMLIAISRWNETFLKSLGLSAPVHLCHQGFDARLFSPGPSSGLFKDRFIIFSGGKFEYRKGQDIAVAAFKRFRAKYPQALLLTCWQNLLPLDPEPFLMVGHCSSVPRADPKRGLQVAAWLAAQGLPEGSFIDLPYTPNMLMPHVLRECDAAIFPNRGEGGTNLVAMEAAACGVPTVVANNTGQRDLVDLLGFSALTHQTPVKTPATFPCSDGWGESDPDEIVAWLEDVYADRAAARQKALLLAERIASWDWDVQNEKLLSIIEASAA